MVGKARVQKRLYYKIGEACKTLGIQPYVLRYWETEFPALAPSKSRSGQRVYSEKEIEIIRRIKVLLYEEGYTIAGAKKKLEAELSSGTLGDKEEEDLSMAEVDDAGESEPVSPAKASKETSEPPPSVRRQPPPPPPAALDTDAAERIQTLRSGIGRALREAREILALLSLKSP
jgi:DNA-binding transcriptional MerR regulator